MLSASKYLFIHVPKTAGTSVLRAFQKILGPREIGPAVGANFDQIDLVEFAKYRMVVGHFRHQQLIHFPGRSMLTLLRDPVDQVLSKYYFYREFADSENPDVLMCQARSLEDLLTRAGREALPFSNSVVRQLAGVGRHVLVPSGEAFNLAAQTLEACEFVGIFEEMADSLDLMSYTFGWPPVGEIPLENVTRGRKRVAECDQKTVELIRKANELDIALYEYGRELFLRRKRAMMTAAVQQRRTAEHGASADAEPSATRTVQPLQAHLRHHLGISAEDPKTPVRIVAVTVCSGPDRSGIRSGDIVEVAVIVVANVAMERVSASIFIYNRYGQLMFSTGMRRHKREYSVTPGQIYRVSFRMPMHLAPGSYSVSAKAATERSGRRVLLHFLEDAASFEVRGYALRRFRGVVNLNPDLSVRPDPDFAETYHVGDTIQFLSDESSLYTHGGWAQPEECGRWTVRDEAHLLMRLDRQPDSGLALDATLLPFCPDQRPELEVEVLINGHLVDTWFLKAPGNVERRQTAVSPEVLAALMHITFRIREPRVPADLGVSTDTRALGICMIELRLSDHPAPLAG